ncbi:Ig-like domain-containing protein, partial [Pseudomonas sp. D47]|uniref:Ig-like domain-containing protein n=1 Tax=Pseudomonas sp. D47 TaxID=3159447 RepID=UPI00387B6688
KDFTISLTADGSPANGTAGNEVKVTVTDSKNVAVQGVTVEFNADNGATIYSLGITDGRGEVRATLSNTQVGVSVVTAKVNKIIKTIKTRFSAVTPDIKDLKVTGLMTGGESLKATYTFDSHGDTSGNNSLFLWGPKGTTAHNVASKGTVVSSNGLIALHNVLPAQAGKEWEVSVLARNKAGGVGKVSTTVLVEAFMSDVVDGKNAYEAQHYCKSKSARMPTIAELRVQFKNSSGYIPYWGTNKNNIDEYTEIYNESSNGSTLIPSIGLQVVPWIPAQFALTTCVKQVL